MFVKLFRVKSIIVVLDFIEWHALVNLMKAVRVI